MDSTGEIPNDLRYTKEHEWVRIEGNNGVVGITDYAQNALTDVVFVELPEVGKKAAQSRTLCTVESVKSVSEVFSPASGEVIEANNELKDKPENINNDPYGKGWIAKIIISNKDELNKLMSAEQYKKYLEGMEH